MIYFLISFPLLLTLSFSVLHGIFIICSKLYIINYKSTATVLLSQVGLSQVHKRAGLAGVSTAAFHARVRGSVSGLGGLKETKNLSSPSTCEYCGEPP